LFDEVRVAGIYNYARSECSRSVQSPVRTEWHTFFTSLGRENSSARKRWSHRSQWGSIPKYPSQTAVKMVALAMEFRLKLCNSSP
jgi:hypothetical protein